MMHFEILIVLMSVAILFVGLSQKLRVPYPIALVIAGSAIGFIPGLPQITFDPSLILVLILPPILYYGAFWLSLKQFKSNWRDIFSLALGLVFATTFILGLLFKWLFPDLPWALAFTFGAIVSPPDATAATSVLKRFSLGPRLLAVLEGESLVNDASAFVLYKITVATLLSGAFSWWEASFEFVKIVSGGALVGLVSGYFLQKYMTRFLSPIVGVIFSLTVPYITFSLSKLFGFSGVLAVVVNGLIASRFLIEHTLPTRRVIAVTTWDIFIILLNCFIFIVLGLELKTITTEMHAEEMIRYTLYGLFFTLITILIRLTWVYFSEGISYLYNRVYLKSHTSPQASAVLKESAVLGWSGMRGIDSLAIALALPLSMPNGTPLEGRDIVIFTTFIVILLTLLLPGFTLPSLLKFLKLHHAPEPHLAMNIRKQLLEAAEKKIATLSNLNEEERSFLKNYFTVRHRILQISFFKEAEVHKLELARQKILQTQRRLLIQLGDKGDIDDKLIKNLELELDMEETQSIRAEL